MKHISLSTFRRVSDAEEAMIRASMPRTAAADPTPLWVAEQHAVQVVSNRSGSRLVRPLTYTIAEAAKAVR